MLCLKIILGQEIYLMIIFYESSVKYSLCMIDVFNETVYKSKSKPKKLWVDQGRAFYNNLMQRWSEDNDILMCSAHIEDKSIADETFTKTLKGKICRK